MLRQKKTNVATVHASDDELIAQASMLDFYQRTTVSRDRYVVKCAIQFRYIILYLQVSAAHEMVISSVTNSAVLYLF